MANSTQMFSGMSDEAKPSSRVLQPPGGGSNHIFGASEPAEGRQHAKPYQKTSLFGSENTPSNDSRGRRQYGGATGVAAAPFASDASAPPVQAPTKIISAPTSSILSPAPPEPQANALKAPQSNPLVGEVSKPIAQADQAAAQAPHTSTRVRQPPGGASSGPLW